MIVSCTAGMHQRAAGGHRGGTTYRLQGSATCSACPATPTVSPRREEEERERETHGDSGKVAVERARLGRVLLVYLLELAPQICARRQRGRATQGCGGSHVDALSKSFGRLPYETM